MSREIKQCLKFNVDTIEVLKFKVRDLNKSTAFVLSSGTFSLNRRPTGAQVASGSLVVDNADTDFFGNTIKTISMTIDLHNTDLDKGSYYLVIFTSLTTPQTDFFRIPVEIIDFRTKGVA